MIIRYLCNMNCRTILLLLLIIISTSPARAQKPTLEEVFRHLDEVVERRPEIHRAHAKNIKDIREMMSQTPSATTYDIAKRMCEAYDCVNNDSSIYYAKQMVESAGDDLGKRQIGKMFLALHIAYKGDYKWAENIISTLGDSILPSNSRMYFQVWDALKMMQNESINPDNELKNSNIFGFTDSVFVYEKNTAGRTINRAQKNIYDNPMAAKDSLLKVASRVDYRFIGKRLGLCYRQLGMRDSAKYYFALSAITDLENGIKSHTSLHLLSIMLYEDGDINRAYNYSLASLEDAISSGVSLRKEQTIRSMPKVLEAYHNALDLQHRHIRYAVVVLIILLLVVSTMLYYTFRINKRLAATRANEKKINEDLMQKERMLNDSLEKQAAVNEQLTESNRVKDVYVAQYMRQSVYNIQQLEQYRLSLQRVATYGNMDKLVTAIKKKDFIEKELEIFYRGFDETFLQIFPHFVEDFNALLQPESRIVVPGGKLMTVDLRIYALIRLGMTDSEEIARFLHYSVHTIYNYRVRIRNSALGPREELELRVREL